MFQAEAVNVPEVEGAILRLGLAPMDAVDVLALLVWVFTGICSSVGGILWVEYLGFRCSGEGIVSVGEHLFLLGDIDGSAMKATTLAAIVAKERRLGTPFALDFSLGFMAWRWSSVSFGSVRTRVPVTGLLGCPETSLLVVGVSLQKGKCDFLLVAGGNSSGVEVGLLPTVVCAITD